MDFMIAHAKICVTDQEGLMTELSGWVNKSIQIPIFLNAIKL